LNAARSPYQIGEPQDLRGPAFLAALLLLLADAIVVFVLAGGFRRLAHRRPASAVIVAAILAAGLSLPPRAHAQSDNFAMKASVETHLAYVVTGDSEVDRISKAGLEGLTLFLTQRTALEP